MRFRHLGFIGSVFTTAFIFSALASAQVIFSEDFAGANDLLDGTAEDTSGEVFAANSFATNDGILNVGQFEGSATLAASLEVNRVYTLSLNVTSASDRWIGIGFSENGSTSVANRPQDRFAQSGGRAWFIYRPNGPSLGQQVQIFAGPNTGGPNIADIDTDFSGATAVPRTLTVVLNTASTGFEADFLIDGVSQSTGFQAIGTNTLSQLDNVGFTFEGPGGVNAINGPISIDDFSFSVLQEQPPLSGQTTFSNVTNARGVGAYRAFAGDIHSPGGVFNDLNNDGFPDLYVVSSDGASGYNRLYLNVADSNGDRVFSLQANALGAANDTGTLGSDPFTQSGANRFRGVTGAIAGDYDNDGDLDLYVINMGLPNRLYENQLIETGALSFTDVTAAAGVTGINSVIRADDSTAATNNSEDSLTAIWFDPDRDGDLDLYVGNHNDFDAPVPFEGAPDTFYINNGDGTFTDATAAFNLGGHEDANGNPGNYADTNVVVSSDINNDGWPDLIVTNKSGSNATGTDNIDQIYINDGADPNGTWLGYTSQTYSALLAPVFDDNLITRSAMGMSLADIDNDGDFDIFMSDNPESGFSGVDASSDLFVNQLVETGSLSFVHGLVDTGLSWGVQIQDFDNDGDVEIHVTNDPNANSGYAALLEFNDLQNLVRAKTNADSNNQLFQGINTDTIPVGDIIANVLDIAVPAGAGNLDANGRGNIAADFNRDGLVDMFLVNLNNDSREPQRDDPSVLLLNTTNNANSFLNVKLIGAPNELNDDGFATSRDAIGSRVVVAVDVDGDGNLEQLTKEIRGGFGNAASTSSYELAFGMGQATEAEVSVVWADGRVTDMGTVSANQFLIVDQDNILNPFLLGDVSQNGIVDFLDIAPFIALLQLNSYMDEADINRDGVVDFLDIAPFISLLSS